jgi:APA family basic amino acid/polyamine antiporter
LSKQLGLVDVFAICTGAMISSGLFVLPGIAAAKVGPAVIVAYLLSGLLLVPSLLSMAEMATAMPRAGGTYFFVSRTLGGLFGTLDGVGVWLALILKTSIALLGLGAYLSAYLHLPMQVVALLGGVLFTATHIVGAKETTRLQVAMVAGLLLILADLAKVLLEPVE